MLYLESSNYYYYFFRSALLLCIIYVIVYVDVYVYTHKAMQNGTQSNSVHALSTQIHIKIQMKEMNNEIFHVHQSSIYKLFIQLAVMTHLSPEVSLY